MSDEFPPRLLAFDVGAARIGVARLTALGTGEPVGALAARGRGFTGIRGEIEALVKKFDVAGFVVGLPKNMDGSRGSQARKSEIFAEKLRRAFPGMVVEMQDERLSTETAMERLAERGVRGGQARQQVDAQAACVIVEDYWGKFAK